MELTEKLMERVEKNPLFKRFVEVGIKEKLFSDVVGALGYMQDNVSKCAYPELIGRSIIAAWFTKEHVEKFPINTIKHKAAKTHEKGDAVKLLV